VGYENWNDCVSFHGFIIALRGASVV
jgi:hypothetical protein